MITTFALDTGQGTVSLDGISAQNWLSKLIKANIPA